MSRHIPKTKLWRVTYWRNGRKVFVHETCTITKLFARWNGRDAFMASGVWRNGGLADKVTIGLVKKGVER